MTEREEIIFDYFKDIKDKKALLSEIDSYNSDYAEELKDKTVEEILEDLKENIECVDSDDWNDYVEENSDTEYFDEDDYEREKEFAFNRYLGRI